VAQKPSGQISMWIHFRIRIHIPDILTNFQMALSERWVKIQWFTVKLLYSADGSAVSAEICDLWWLLVVMTVEWFSVRVQCSVYWNRRSAASVQRSERRRYQDGNQVSDQLRYAPFTRSSWLDELTRRVGYMLAGRASSTFTRRHAIEIHDSYPDSAGLKLVSMWTQA